MDTTLQYLIFNMVNTTITTIMTVIQIKYKEEIFFLWEIIKKSLLLKPSITSFSNLDVFNKVFFLVNLLLKIIKRWNQANLRYFNPYLNNIYNKGEIVLMKKKVYYKNMMLFI